MSNDFTGDTLVIQFKEYKTRKSDEKKTKHDLLKDVYLFYDLNFKAFGVRGRTYKRDNTSGGEISTGNFSFYFSAADKMVLFLNTIFTNFECMDVFVLAYPGLPTDPDELTYDLFEYVDTNETVISKQSFCMDSLPYERFVKIVESAFNWYEPPASYFDAEVDEDESDY